MTRFASSFAILLCGSVLAGCAGDKDQSLLPGLSKAASAGDEAAPTDLDSGIRQAQLERLAGHYDKAIHVLSQLMLVASDDPRVVGEYGKSLAEQGRAEEAVQFLSRASELQPKDWTLFSALGVAYDEESQEDLARKAYERALVLKPDEPSVLNNYALSRMMANDPGQARQLMAEAEKAGGASDAKIARNIAMVKSLAADMPAATPKAQAAANPAPTPVTPNAAPRPLVPLAQKPAAPQVVMEPVPADPLAGPVKPQHPAVPKIKPAVPDEKPVKAAEAALPTKSEIPGLRETALAY